MEEETDNCKTNIPELFLLNEQLIWLWFFEQNLFDFSPSVVHLRLFPLFFIMQKICHSNMYAKNENQNAESENKNTKRRIETKNITYFCFWIKWCWRANSMKKTSCISKDSSNFSKSRFDYFCHSLVNFKNLIIIFWNIWVMYGSWKS